jgi:alanine dehydrogenase
MSSRLKIFIRKEIYENEIRTPLIPKDVKILIDNNFIVYVQSSNYRIYSDELYEKEGAIITVDNWFNEKYKKAIIIGIKEIDNLEKLNNHKHLYFSHSYRKQKNSNIILNAFKESNSIIYDFEFFLNNNKRIIAFGCFAGFVGAILGIKQFYNKKMQLNNINNLSPWLSFEEMFNYIYINIEDESSTSKYKIFNNDIKIGIIGSEGRCGTGVKFILDIFNIKYIKYMKHKNFENNYDIIFNCILLDEKYDKIWFDKNTNFLKDTVIVDISCDYTKKNNPIQLYNKATSWIEPVFKYNKFVDIIAIENLPSLLPFESSNDFSKNCKNLLLQYGSEIWRNNLEIFYSVIKNLE